MRHDNARQSVKVLKNAVANYQNILEKLKVEYLWTDSSVLTDVKQRWKTTDLYKHLMRPYFYFLIDYILSLVHDKILENSYNRFDSYIDQSRVEIWSKEKCVKQFKRRYHRMTQMRRKRSDFAIFKRSRISMTKKSVPWMETIYNMENRTQKRFQTSA